MAWEVKLLMTSFIKGILEKEYVWRWEDDWWLKVEMCDKSKLTWTSRNWKYGSRTWKLALGYRFWNQWYELQYHWKVWTVREEEIREQFCGILTFKQRKKKVKKKKKKNPSLALKRIDKVHKVMDPLGLLGWSLVTLWEPLWGPIGVGRPVCQVEE